MECNLAKPRVVKCVGERILVMGDQGELVSYTTVTNKCSSLYKDSSLASYSLLEVDNDRVVMSGLTGQVVTGMLQFMEDRDMLVDIVQEHVEREVTIVRKDSREMMGKWRDV